jgi:flagellar hook-associated protein 1 FlgK
VRGVNLDEEAADMLRFEQLYQAAAQTIAVADGMFSTLLAALRG